MRLPEGLRGPPRLPRTWWIAGAGVMVILVFVAMAMPWFQVGQRVYDSELPRPRLHGRLWGAAGCIGPGYDEVAVDRTGQVWGERVRIADPDAWIRERRTHTLVLRAHRLAPWSVVARILESAARVGNTGILFQVGDWNFLELKLETGDAEITITRLPLPDPEGTLASTREHAGRSPLVRVDLAAEANVEMVLHAVECFAADEYDPVLRLAVRR